MVPVASSVTFVAKFHIRYISVVRSLYFKIFRILSSSLSPYSAMSIITHVPF